DDGTITFQPEPSFVGKGQGVRVQAADKNGTKVSDTYTPTVTDVTMSSENAVSRKKQGETQSGTPSFTTSDPSVTITGYKLEGADEEGKVVVPGEGTYTVDPETGKVTFVPEPGFTGPGTGVTVTATDSNGETATATYTPTVDPITAEGTDKETSGKQGQVQSGTPSFTVSDESATLSGYKLEGADEEGKVVVPGEGTYTVDPQTGKVTFTPEPGFTGPGTGVTV
ncbi:cell surface-associated protein, partial [Streptococcus cuniculipharyngis]